MISWKKKTTTTNGGLFSRWSYRNFKYLPAIFQQHSMTQYDVAYLNELLLIFTFASFFYIQQQLPAIGIRLDSELEIVTDRCHLEPGGKKGVS